MVNPVPMIAVAFFIATLVASGMLGVPSVRAQTTGFTAGARVQTILHLRVRKAPDARMRLGIQKRGAPGTIVEGPTTAKGNIWWKIDSGVDGWSAQAPGLTASTPYSYDVSAYDAADNNSAQSSTASATTQSGSISGGINYYVGGSGASDSNPGTSPTAPWASISKVNSFTFPAGSIIHQQANLSGNLDLEGSNMNGPITYDGGGFALTAATGGTAAAGDTFYAVLLNGLTKGVTFQNTVVRPAAQPTQFGILAQNGTSGTIQGNNVGGFTLASGGDASADIYAGGSNLTVTNNVVGGLNGAGSADDAGIRVYGYSGNVTVTFNTVQNIGGRPGSTGASNGYSGNGILIGWANTPCDQKTSSCTITIEHNLVTHVGGNITQCGGPSGILSYDVPAILNVGYNEVSFTQPLDFGAFNNGLCDEDGIDFDGGTLRASAYNNYTHDNAGLGLFGWMGTAGQGSWGPNSYTNNYSLNDYSLGWNNGYFIGNGFVGTGAPNPVAHFEGNYIDSSPSTANTGMFGFSDQTQMGSGGTVKNNVFVARNANAVMGKCYPPQDPRQKWIFSGNRYYGATFTMGQGCGNVSPSTLATWQSSVLGGDDVAVFAPVSQAPTPPALPVVGAGAQGTRANH